MSIPAQLSILVMNKNKWLQFSPAFENTNIFRLGKWYVVKHNCVTKGVFSDYIG